MINPLADLLASLSSSGGGITSVFGSSTQDAQPASSEESTESFDNILQALMTAVAPQQMPTAATNAVESSNECSKSNGISNSMQTMLPPPPPPPLLPPPPPELTGLPSFEQLSQVLAQRAETAKTGETLPEISVASTPPSVLDSTEESGTAKAILLPMMPPPPSELIAPTAPVSSEEVPALTLEPIAPHATPSLDGLSAEKLEPIAHAPTVSLEGLSTEKLEPFALPPTVSVEGLPSLMHELIAPPPPVSSEGLPAVDGLRSSPMSLPEPLPKVPTPVATATTPKVDQPNFPTATANATSTTDDTVSVGGWRDEASTTNHKQSGNTVQLHGWEDLNARVVSSTPAIARSSQPNLPPASPLEFAEFSANLPPVAPTNLPTSPLANAAPPTVPAPPVTPAPDSLPTIEPPAMPNFLSGSTNAESSSTTTNSKPADITAILAPSGTVPSILPGLLPPVVPIFNAQLSALDPLGALRGEVPSPTLREDGSVPAPTVAPSPFATSQAKLPDDLQSTFSVAAGKSSPIIQAADGIIDQAHPSTGKGETDFHLRLDPPELGTIHVHLHTSADGTTTARLVIPDEGVRRLIESQIAELRERLEAAGVKIGSCDVSRDDGRNGNHSSYQEQVAAWMEAPLPPRNPRGYEGAWKPASSASTVAPGRIDVSV